MEKQPEEPRLTDPLDPVVVQDVRELRSARDRYLSKGRVSPLVRSVVERSWSRCSMLGVPPDRTRLEAIGRPHIEAWIREAMSPILDDLGDKVHRTSATVMVADPEGTVVEVRGDREVLRLLESVQPIPGSVLSEDLAGTNAVGTAIEEGTGVQICSGEHFIEAFQTFTCSAIPIRHPLKKNIVAVLDVTTRDTFPSVIGAEVVGEAARQIEKALYERLTARERALLFYYLQELRASRGPVVASDGRTIIASDGAVRLLDHADYAVLWHYVGEVMRLSRSLEQNVRLTSGRDVHLAATPRYDGGEPAGVVIRLRPVPVRPAGPGHALAAGSDVFASLVGQSPAFRQATDLARTAAAEGLAVGILGEPGTGKLSLARALATAAGRVSVIECMAVDMRSRTWITQVRDTMREAEAVIFRHVEALKEAGRAALLRLFDEAEAQSLPRIIFTACLSPQGKRGNSHRVQDFLSRLAVVTVTLPPLRERREDIPLLARALLEGEHGHPQAQLTPEVLQVLGQARWPGNVRQLKNTLVRALMQARGSEITIHDLPDELITDVVVAKLSRLEQVELEALRDALAEAGGNKVKAAALLGISRSSLYRKLESYRLIGINLGA